MPAFEELQVSDIVTFDGDSTIYRTSMAGRQKTGGNAVVVCVDHRRGEARLRTTSYSTGWRSGTELIIKAARYPDIKPDWLTPDVRAVASQLHGDPAWHDMNGFLHDALLDAGCDDQTVLDSVLAGQSWVVRSIVLLIEERHQ